MKAMTIYTFTGTTKAGNRASINIRAYSPEQAAEIAAIYLKEVVA